MAIKLASPGRASSSAPGWSTLQRRQPGPELVPGMEEARSAPLPTLAAAVHKLD